MLTISSEEHSDSIEFYLADYRFEDNTLDYLINEWTYIDLSSLSDAGNLKFTLTSSDVGMFGINTPTYFCVDNIELDETTSTDNVLSSTVKVYPNPTTDFVSIDIANIVEANISIYSTSGQLLITKKILGKSNIDISNLNKGIYIAKITTEQGSIMKQLAKQ